MLHIVREPEFRMFPTQSRAKILGIVLKASEEHINKVPVNQRPRTNVTYLSANFDKYPASNTSSRFCVCTASRTAIVFGTNPPRSNISWVQQSYQRYSAKYSQCSKIPVCVIASLVFWSTNKNHEPSHIFESYSSKYPVAPNAPDRGRAPVCKISQFEFKLCSELRFRVKGHLSCLPSPFSHPPLISGLYYLGQSEERLIDQSAAVYTRQDATY